MGFNIAIDGPAGAENQRLQKRLRVIIKYFILIRVRCTEPVH